jgi:hypothetical protein
LRLRCRFLFDLFRFRFRCRRRRAALHIPRALDLQLHQRRADRRHLAGLAMDRGHLAGYRRGHLDRRLVGHHVDQVLVLGDDVADLDVPGDDLGLGGAFADIGKLEDVVAHL